MGVGIYDIANLQIITFNEVNIGIHFMRGIYDHPLPIFAAGYNV
jgi:hypothetical protein